MESQIVLVLGGARSGKSDFAVRLARGLAGPVLFVATAIPGDSEMRMRISEHRKHRPAEWRMLEVPVDVSKALVEHLSGIRVVVLDCVSMLVANILLQRGEDYELSVEQTAHLERQAVAEVEAVCRVCRQAAVTLVVVSNEVGMGVVPPYPLGRAFRDVLGRVNQTLARQADRVYFLLAGIPWELKGVALQPHGQPQ